MNRTRSVIALIIIGVLVALSACAKPPVAEMDAAATALARAEADADARSYAPDSLARARDLAARMQAASEARNYAEAKALAAEAQAAADKAIRDGSAAKTRAKADAESALANAKAALTEANQALARARAIKSIILDARAVEAEIAAAASSINGAEGDLSSFEYRGAAAKAQAARSALASIAQRMGDAVQTATRKK